MADSISYSFDINLTPSAPTGPAPALALAYCSVTPLSGGMLLLRNKRTGRTGVVQAAAYNLLAAATRFRPLDEHVREIAGQDAGLQPGDVRKTLEALRGLGLLVEAAEVRSRLAERPARVEAPAEPVDVYVATSDRPEALARLLASLADNAGGAFPVQVLDDSRREASRSENVQIVRRAAQERGLAVQYRGEPEDAQFVEALKNACPGQAAAIDFLLRDGNDMDAITPGRTFNKALLRSAGRRLVRVDDDVVCRLCRAPDTRAGLEISARSRDVAFLQGDAGWEDFIAEAGGDPLAEMDRHLGRAAAEIIGALCPAGLDDQALAWLRSDEALSLAGDSRVLVTGCGSLGDPGMASNAWLYDLDGEARTRLVADAGLYAEHKSGRNVWFGRRQANMSPRFALISQITGLDNRALLPPYFPFFRNEDYLFGQLVQLLHPGAVMLDLPWAVPHLPIPRRRWDEDASARPAGLGFQQFVAEFLSRRERLYGDSAEARRRQLGEILHALAEASDPLLLECVEEQRLDMQADLVRSRDQLLKAAAGRPDYWAADVQKSIRANLQALASPAQTLLSDFPSDLPQPAQLMRLRGWLGQYADALDAWPHLRGVCMQMNGAA